MSTFEHSAADSERTAQASEWFMRLRDGPVTDQIVDAWLQWCESHPDNARCYRQLQSIWSRAGDAGMAGWPDEEQVRNDRYGADISVREWQLRAGQRAVANAPSVQARNRSRGRPSVPMALAAALVLGICAWQLTLYMTRLPATGVYSAQRGEKLDLRLADGSTLTLGGSSVVRIAYGENRRDIHLEQGEAFFSVRKDRNRPFVVTAPNLTVTAIGTAFAVRADDTRTVVSVTEGLVEVVQEKATSHQPGGSGRPRVAMQPDPAVVRARAGEQVTFDANTAYPVLRAADVSAAIGWQDGAFVYVDEPLRSVVARINRYASEEVVLVDASLGELQFTGTVFEHQVAEWARGLERVFPVDARQGPDGQILLEWRERRDDDLRDMR